MLCERCQSNEATVHFSAVAWPTGDLTKHLCETCYPKDEAERTASYEAKRKPLPVINFTARERAAMELLGRALESLEKGDDAGDMVGFGIGLSNSVPGAKTSALVQLLERIFLRSVELLAKSSSPPSDHPFGLGLTIAGNALRQADPGGFSTLLESLKAQQGDLPIHAVLDYLERRQTEKWGRRKRGSDV
jgi:hypothetical protein